MLHNLASTWHYPDVLSFFFSQSFYCLLSNCVVTHWPIFELLFSRAGLLFLITRNDFTMRATHNHWPRFGHVSLYCLFGLVLDLRCKIPPPQPSAATGNTLDRDFCKMQGGIDVYERYPRERGVKRRMGDEDIVNVYLGVVGHSRVNTVSRQLHTFKTKLKSIPSVNA